MKQQSLFDEKTDITTSPLFSQSAQRVEVKPFVAKVYVKQASIFGQMTLEQMAASVKK